MDTCGIPNKANWHVHVILARFTEEFIVGEAVSQTTETDIYVCDEHMPADLAVAEVGESTTLTPQEERNHWIHYEADVRKLLHWDGHENWDILELTVSHLR